MHKKNEDSEFSRMLDELMKDYEKKLLTERIKRGLKKVKQRKSRKQR